MLDILGCGNCVGYDGYSLAQLATQQIQQCTLACGINHAAVVSNNQLYTWGSTKNGK